MNFRPFDRWAERPFIGVFPAKEALCGAARCLASPHTHE